MRPRSPLPALAALAALAPAVPAALAAAPPAIAAGPAAAQAPGRPIPARGPGEAAGPWLARLAAPAAAERDRAQAWLAARLEPRDFPAVARAAEGLDAEGARRLVQALSADDRHLGLAVLLACEPAPALAELGARAAAELYATWTGDGETLDGPRLRGRLEGREARAWVLAAEELPLADAVDRLARVARPPVRLVLDPSLDPAVDRLDRALDGAERFDAPSAWDGILRKLARGHRVELAGFAFAPPPRVALGGPAPLGPRAWVWIHRSGEEPARPAERVLAWCAAVERGAVPADGSVPPPRPPGEAAAAARALGALGWPASLAWLERRWLERADAAALDGLLVAASRGRVVPALGEPSVQADVLAIAAADLAAGTPDGRRRAQTAARALAEVGARGPEPGALARLCADRLREPALDPAAAWVPLVVLEAQPSAPPAVLELLAERLAARGPAAPPPWLALQTLRTWVALAPPDAPPPVLGRARAPLLVDRALAEGAGAELVDLVRAGRLAVPDALREPGLLPPGWGVEPRALVLAWALAVGDDAAARAHLAGLRRLAEATDGATGGPAGAAEPPPAALVAVLREHAAHVGPTRARADLARVAPGAEADLLGLLAGLAPPAAARARLAAALDRTEPEGADLLVLGALAAGVPHAVGAAPAGAPADAPGADARAALEAALRRVADPGQGRDLVRALTLAVEALRDARLDAELAAFVGRVGRLARERRGAPWAEALRSAFWPPPRRAPAAPLRAGDRALP